MESKLDIQAPRGLAAPRSLKHFSLTDSITSFIMQKREMSHETAQVLGRNKRDSWFISLSFLELAI